MEFKVGDLLIEERWWPAGPDWKPRIGICMEPVTGHAEEAEGVEAALSVLVQGKVILSWSKYWRVACRAE
jgi:hypothetical protein